MAIFLRESDVKELASMRTAIEAVEQAFKLQGEHQVEIAPGGDAVWIAECST